MYPTAHIVARLSLGGILETSHWLSQSCRFLWRGPRNAQRRRTTGTKPSAHFAIWSNAGDGQTRDLLWQFEQIRFAVKTLWPWTLELTKPMLVLGVKDEEGMKALAPRYWEQKGGVRPVSVWVSGLDQHTW